MMLILLSPQLVWAELEEFPGIFYTVSLNRRTHRHEIHLLENELTISAARIRADMQDLVCKFISSYEGSTKLHLISNTDEINFSIMGIDSTPYVF